MTPSDGAGTREDLVRVLRVGILVDRLELPAWLHLALERIVTLAGVKIALVLREEDAPGRAASRARGRAFALYERLDRRYLGGRPDPLTPRELRSLLGPDSECVVQRSPENGALLAEESLERVRRADLDVLLHLGARPLDGEALSVPRLGVWTWSQLEAPRRGRVPLLGEIRRPDAVCEVALLALRPGGEPDRLLVRSWSTSDPNAREPSAPVSLHRARTIAYWKSAAFAERALRAVSRAGIASSPDLAAAGGPIAETVEAEPLPGLAGTASLSVAIASRMARRRLRRWRSDALWSIAWRPRRTDAPVGAMDGFRFLAMPAGRFWADPFVVSDAGRHYLFFEDGDVATQRGRIGCLELDAKGQPGRTATVLERETSLSYPFVFRWQAQWWMIPESSASRTVELHRAIGFPWHWQLDRVLFDDLHAADSTVWLDGDRLWLFTAIAGYGASDTDELFLFSANDVRGPWRPHPRNPVVSDVRRARPAGRPFREGGALIRPGQDCSEAYGGAISLQRVVVLTEEEYREEPHRRIAAHWCAGSVATHTFDRSADFEVVDARRLVPRRRARAGS